MVSSSQKFQLFEERGSKALEVMKNRALKPLSEKTLRTWTPTEVCQMLGKSTQTLREHEKKGNIPTAKTHGNTKKRFYTLENINEIRRFFNLTPTENKENPAVIAFTNFKGGVAKTTSAIHTAQYFAKNGYRVLLIDTDSQASATSSFGIAPDEEIQDHETLLPFFLGQTQEIKDIIRQTYWHKLDLIPANLGLYGVELELPVIKAKEQQHGESFLLHNILHKGIQQIQDEYDIVLIDCPPSMSILNTNALFSANILIIPCPPELPDIASMVQFFGMIKGVLKKVPEKDFNAIRILITKHDGSSSAHTVSTALRSIYGSYVMRAEMAITQVIKKARTEMQSVYELKKYRGSKHTLNRAIQILDDINSEIELLVKQMWEKHLAVEKKTSLMEEV